MVQLYKKRNFSSLINDTFSFFRTEGKSYFRGYFIINGGLLLVLMLLMYLVGKIFFDGIFSGIGNPRSDEFIETYFASNTGLFVGAGIFTGIVAVVLTLLSYSFPVFYLNLLEKKQKPSVSLLLSALKAKTGRLVIFALLWLVTFLPILMLLGVFSILLFAIIIGIPVAFILFAAAWCWMCLAFFDYLNNNTGYLRAMINGWEMLFSNFWHYAGVTAIFYVIVTILHSIISFIPYIFGIFSIIGADGFDSSNPESFSFFGLMMLITFMLSMLLSYILGNVLFVNQGIIYYTAREEKNNHSLHSEIDLIGTDSE